MVNIKTIRGNANPRIWYVRSKFRNIVFFFSNSLFNRHQVVFIQRINLVQGYNYWAHREDQAHYSTVMNN